MLAASASSPSLASALSADPCCSSSVSRLTASYACAIALKVIGPVEITLRRDISASSPDATA